MTVMLLEWIFTSMFLILVVLALRAALGKRVSAHLRYALWAVVLVRLLVPVQLFTSPIAGMWVFLETHTEQNVTEWPITSDARATAGPNDVLFLNVPDALETLTTFPQVPAPPTVPNAPEAPAAPDLTKAPVWLGWAWLAGAAAVCFILLLSNLRFYWTLRRERVLLEKADCPLRVYVAVGLPSPCLFGILRPAIYVTPDAVADPDMLRHVLAHEYTHYRQVDHIWSLLRCGALTVHWWNPLVWLAAVLSQRDAELACDEGALKRLGNGERAGYGNTLLALVTAKPRPSDLLRCATTMAGDKKSLKERISRIACAPKRILWAAIAAVLVTALACVCAFGQAAEDEPGKDQDGETNLSCSLDENGNVSITGTVLGMTLEPGTYWQPTGAPANTLTMRYLPFTDGIEGAILAYWEDGSRQTVTVNTYMMAAASSYVPSGYWVFTVDLSGEAGVITQMTPETGSFPSGTEIRMYPESISDEEAVRAARIAAKLLTAAEEYYQDQQLAEPGSFRQTDLNRNGVPETLRVVDIELGQRLEVWENSELLFSEEGHTAHVGYNAIFLCTLDGKDYLLRYHPYMSQGWCGYEYRLFTLENGRETLASDRYIEFDINFGQLMHESFDPEAIAAFMAEVNDLLAHSVQLINTDEYLLNTFNQEGQLVDTLWWLDSWEPTFVRDEGKSLLANLRNFKEAMEKQWYTETPTVFPVDELGTDILLRYKDEQKRFQGEWDYNFQPERQVEEQIQVIDLNGDGREEIVFPLVWGHGTGCYGEHLYLFDAETLEQYDTSEVEDMILSQVTSYADEDRFYVSAPGLEAEIEKPDIDDYTYNDSVSFGDYYRFRVENGRLYGLFGAALDRSDLCYCGTLKVELRLDGRTLICAGFEYLTANVDD